MTLCFHKSHEMWKHGKSGVRVDQRDGRPINQEYRGETV